MRINVYTEELAALFLDEEGRSLPDGGIYDEQGRKVAEIVTADYISSRTGKQMTNHGLRIYLRSPPELHYVLRADGSVRDDDRSAVTFWCGPKEKNVLEFLHTLGVAAQYSTLKRWRAKTQTVFNKTFVPSGFPGHTMVQRFEDPTLGTVTKEGGDTPGKGVPLCPICDQPIGNCEHLG